MRICYAGASAPSAFEIADVDPSIRLHRGSTGDINWGRRTANTALNPDISNSVNKRKMRELFASHDVPTPKLYKWLDTDPSTGSNHQMALLWALRHGTTLVGRPDYHSRGRGLWIVRTVDDLHRALRGTRKKRAATHFMEFIDAPHEYRVHIFKGKSIRISEKMHGQIGETAHGNYTTAKPTDRVWHVRKAAKQAVAAIGLDFGAVDVLADSENCWVLEVNASPGLGGSMPRLYAETFKRYFEGGTDE